MEPEEVLISIVIPVKNGDPWIESCIQGIMNQTLYKKCEIIVLDSGSTDKTLSILENYPVRIYNIPPNEFNHGLTRNFGVTKCIGKYVLMTVQDAKPYDEYWIEKLLAGFIDDAVVAVCGAQVVPHDSDKNPVEWFRPASEPFLSRYQFTSPDEYLALSAEDKKNIGGWDDVNAMYRRDILTILPFREIVYGEDAIWAQEAYLKGYALCFQPSARVYHYHLEDRNYAFKRTLTAMYLRYKTFGFIQPKPVLTLKNYLTIINILFFRSDGISLIGKLKWWRYNMNLWKGRIQAHNSFTRALRISDEELDKVHEEFCGKPPIPLKYTEYA